MKPRILVTGGTGLLGSYLLRQFKSLGYENLTATYQNPSPVIQADLENGIEWKRLRLPDIPDAMECVAGHDWVVHNAGLISYKKEDKYRLLEVNQKGTAHIVNACLAHGVRHLVYIGSIGAIGKETAVATLRETDPWIENKYTTSYGLSKYLGELEAWRGAAEGLNVSVILPAVILGAGDWKRSSLQLIDRVAHKIPFYPGGQTGYVDVRDVAKFTSIVLEKGLVGERWILSEGNYTYGDIFRMIAGALKLNRKFREAPSWMAKLVLFAGELRSGRFGIPDLADQLYAKFSYDSSKSRMVEGFHYRLMEETIRDLTPSSPSQSINI